MKTIINLIVDLFANINIFFKKLLNISFIRSTGVMISGTAVAQLILVLFTPVLTRLYSPESFGEFSIFFGILTTIAAIASLRYHMAIPLPKLGRIATHIIVLASATSSILALLFSALIIYFQEYISSRTGWIISDVYLIILPLAILSLSGIVMLTTVCLRYELFRELSQTKIIIVLFTLASQLALYNFGGFGLALGYTCGQFVGVVLLSRYCLINCETTKIKPRIVAMVAKRYRNFPIYDTWSTLANTVGNQLPPILFAALYGVSAAGYYLLATRVLSLPVAILGQAIAAVYYSRAAEVHRQGKLGKLTNQVTQLLFEVAIIPTLIVIISGPDLFSLVFDEKWEQSGQFAQWMIVWLFFVFVASPTSSIFMVTGKQSEWLIFQSYLLLARACAILFGAWLDSLLTTVALFSMASALCWVGLLCRVSYITKLSLAQQVLTFTKSTILGSLCLAPFVVAEYMNLQSIFVWGIAPSVLLSAAFYYGIFRKRFKVSI